MTRQSKRVVVFGITPALIASVVALLVSGNLTPWDMMSRAEAKQEHRELQGRIDKHEQRIEAKIDRVAEDVAHIRGILSAEGKGKP